MLTNRHLLAALLGALLSAMALSACEDSKYLEEPTLTSNVDDWRDEIIYQIIIDRFADGDPNNNYNVNKEAMGKYHGGDYQGVIDNIWYLKELGVTSVWVSPVVKNVEDDAGHQGYHGYWTQDFLSVNPHFGDLAKLREMVDALHEAGISVILDIVANHVGQLFYYDINKNGVPDEATYGEGVAIDGNGNVVPLSSGIQHVIEYDPDFDPNGIQSWTSLGYSGPAPVVWVYDPVNNHMPPLPEEFQNTDWYNKKGRVTAWSKPTTCEELRYQETMGDFPGGLKDLNTQHPEVRKALVKVFQYWIEAADFDGFRIDTLKHVETDFWGYFCPHIRQFAKAKGKDNFFMFGEAFDGQDHLIGSYTYDNGVDSVFYFSQKFQVYDAVFKNNGPTKAIEELYQCRFESCEYNLCDIGDFDRPHFNNELIPDGIGVPPSKSLVNFMENHDIPRFLYDKPDTKALQSAFAYLLTQDGIPCIYYGSEQEFNGGNDPANREDMTFDTTNETFQVVKKLTALRTAYAPLRRGEMDLVWTTYNTDDEEDAGIVAFERTYQGQTVLVIINTKDGYDDPSKTGSSPTFSEEVEGETRTYCMDLSIPTGTQLTDVYGTLPNAVTVQDKQCWVDGAVQTNQYVDVELGPREFVVLVPTQNVTPL